MESVLSTCFTVANRIYEPQIFDLMFKGTHGFRLVDQLCENVGRIMMVQSGYRLLDRVFDKQTVAFLVSGLQPKGGGIFLSICNLIAIHINEGKKILIVCSGMAETDMSGITELLNNCQRQ